MLLSIPALVVDENSYHITVEDDFSYLSYDWELSSLISDLTRAIAKAPDLYGYTEADLQDISVIGPYKIFTENGLNKWKVTRENYHFMINGVVKGVLTTYIKNGELNCEYSIGYSTAINAIPKTQNYVLVENDDGIYCITETDSVIILNSYELDVPGDISPYNNATTKNNIASIKYNTIAPFQEEVHNISFINAANNANVLNTRASGHTSVPLVPQYESGIQKWCHNACIASVAAARDPDNYEGLTAGEVYDTAGLTYLISSNRAKYIHDKMKEYYLSTGHSSTYSTTTDLTISSFKSGVSDGWLYIAIATWDLSNGTGYHTTVMNDYTTLSSGGIFVGMMDPYTETFRLITWTSGTFSYTQSGSITATLDEYVVSYY